MAILAGACVLASYIGISIMGLLAVACYLVCLLPTLRECLVHNAGHRAGAEGFDGMVVVVVVVMGVGVWGERGEGGHTSYKNTNK